MEPGACNREALTLTFEMVLLRVSVFPRSIGTSRCSMKLAWSCVMLSCLGSLTPMHAQPSSPLPPPDREIVLYDGIPSGSEGWNFEERTIYNTDVGIEFTQNVDRPSLMYYAAVSNSASGAAVIIAPGGGGVNLSIRIEGTDVAQQLTRAGIAAFVLKYRLVGHPVDSPMSKAYARDENGVVLQGPQKGQNVRALAIADGARAVAWLRANASRFGCLSNRIGFIGFSAGGFLGSQLIDGPAESRPDFIAFIYGADSNLKPGSDAPPAFFASALDDTWAIGQTLTLFEAWRSASRPAELHVFQTGGHGFLAKRWRG